MPQENGQDPVLKRLLKSGTQYATLPYHFIKIYAANATGIAAILAGAMYSVVSFFEDPVLSLYPFSGVISSTLAFYLIQKGQHTIGRYLIAVWLSVSNGLFHAHAVTVGESMIPVLYLSQIAFSLISWVIFDWRERKWFISAIVINLTFISFQPLLNDWYEPATTSQLADNIIFHITAYPVAIFSFVGCMVSFINQNIRNENFIRRQKQEIESHNVALTSQKESLQQVVHDIQLSVEEAVTSGNFNQQFQLKSEQDEWVRLSTAINTLFQSMAQPSKVISRIVDHMASGDLSHRYEEAAKGDILVIKNSFNQALNDLNHLLQGMVQKTAKVSDSAEDMIIMGQNMQATTTEISASINEISKGSDSQMNQIDQSSQLLESLVTTSAETGRQAQEILEQANIGVQMSHEGLNMIEDIEQNMQQIMENSTNTSKSVQSLAQRSNEITGILKIIEEIASQTNLLALNAAIEAAQAGEAGRGFAVVATEIRRLAEESKNSIKSIDEIITGIQSEVKTTHDHIRGMETSIQTGQEATMNSVNRFQKIEAASQDTLIQTQKIVQDTAAQHEGLKQIVGSVEEVVVIANETAAGASEAATAAVDMSKGMVNYVEKSQEVLDILQELQKNLHKYRLANQA